MATAQAAAEDVGLVKFRLQKNTKIWDQIDFIIQNRIFFCTFFIQGGGGVF